MLIKKIFFPVIILALSIFLSFSVTAADISARSCVLMVADTKEVIFEKNAYDKRSMASTTKIMTSVIASESGRLSEIITVTADMLEEGSSMGLREGYKLTLGDLVYGMLLESGNDAANACALTLSKDFEGFARIMNNKARELGMNSTSFVTPSGLDAQEHYSTAYDMALLAACALENPELSHIFTAKSYEVNLIEPDISLKLYNHNKLLSSLEGTVGLKTGFTKKSGRCLVSACRRQGATLICVTLDAYDDWNDHKRLYDSFFSELNKRTVTPPCPSQVNIYGSEREKIPVSCSPVTYHYYSQSSEGEWRVVLPPIIYAPVSRGEILGRAEYISKGRLIAFSHIVASEGCFPSEEKEVKEYNIFDRLKDFFKKKG